MTMEIEQKPKLSRVVPSRDYFEASQEVSLTPKEVHRPGQLTTTIIRVEQPAEGGTLVWNMGDKYPQKALVFAEAVFACDVIKRAIIDGARFLTSSPIRYIASLFVILPTFLKRKVVDNAILRFSDFCEMNWKHWGEMLKYRDADGNTFGLNSILIKPKNYCDIGREIYRVGNLMAKNESEAKLVEAICMILQFDDAYRYMIQDGFGEISKVDVLSNPVKELNRVFGIMAERGAGTQEKFETFKKIIPFVANLKIFKDAIRKFFTLVDIEKLKLDEADWYRCLYWGGYQFRGISDTDRMSMRMMIDAEWTYKEQQLKK